MNNVILFESVESDYYGIYNIATQELYDSEGRYINDINDILYNRYGHLRWNKQYKDICIDGCSANGLDTVSVQNINDTIIAYSVEGSYTTIIEFV